MLTFLLILMLNPIFSTAAHINAELEKKNVDDSLIVERQQSCSGDSSVCANDDNCCPDLECRLVSDQFISEKYCLSKTSGPCYIDPVFYSVTCETTVQTKCVMKDDLCTGGETCCENLTCVDFEGPNIQTSVCQPINTVPAPSNCEGGDDNGNCVPTDDSKCMIDGDLCDGGQKCCEGLTCVEYESSVFSTKVCESTTTKPIPPNCENTEDKENCAPIDESKCRKESGLCDVSSGAQCCPNFSCVKAESPIDASIITVCLKTKEPLQPTDDSKCITVNDDTECNKGGKCCEGLTCVKYELFMSYEVQFRCLKRKGQCIADGKDCKDGDTCCGASSCVDSPNPTATSKICLAINLN